MVFIAIITSQRTMPSIHTIDKQRKLIITTWQGDISDDDLIQSLSQYQQDYQNLPEYQSFHEVLDFSHAGKITLTTTGIRNLSKIAVSTDSNRQHTKLAIIVNNTLAYGLARMYISYRGLRNDTGKYIQIFKAYDQAISWIIDN